MTASRGYSNGLEAIAHIHRRKYIPGDATDAIPDLAFAVDAPRPHCAIPAQCETMDLTSGDRDEAANWRGSDSHRYGRKSRLSSPVAKLAHCVGSPRPNRVLPAVILHRERMFETSRYRDDPLERIAVRVLQDLPGSR